MSLPVDLPNVRVGVSALIRDEHGRFLVGNRKGSHGHGTMQIPGGHLEHGEDVFACAERETLEETGLVVKADRIPTITNDVFKVEAKHYITIYVLCDMVNPDATPKAMEPNKCDGWSWKTQKELRQIHEAAKLDLSVQQLFLPLINLFNQTPDLHALLATDGIANGTL